MTDVEHELVRENQALRDRVTSLAELARRALAAAIDAQDQAHGSHDRWLDDAFTAVDEELTDSV